MNNNKLFGIPIPKYLSTAFKYWFNGIIIIIFIYEIGKFLDYIKPQINNNIYNSILIIIGPMLFGYIITGFGKTDDNSNQLNKPLDPKSNADSSLINN